MKKQEIKLTTLHSGSDKLSPHRLIMKSRSEYREVPLLGRVPPASSEAVRQQMKGNRGSDTRPEIALRSALQKAGLRGYRLRWKNAPGSPDIAYVGRRVAIFVHGCFWHSCPHCQIARPRTNSEYWARKFIRNKERDERKVRELNAARWKVLELWECQIKANVESCVTKIREALIASTSHLS
jgi:DNA mismatch endonuclease (patch repair protein)